MNPSVVYLDTTVLLSYLIEDDVNYRHAHSVFKLVQEYSNLKVTSSTWTIIEAHRKLYKNILTKNPKKANNQSYRRKFISQAENRITDLLQEFADIGFQLITDFPSALLVRDIARECDVWPNDAIHFAIALREGSDLFITDDKKFYKSIKDNYRFIEKYINEEFNQLPSDKPKFTPYKVGEFLAFLTSSPRLSSP